MVASALLDEFAARLNSGLAGLDFSAFEVGKPKFSLEVLHTIKGADLAGTLARHPMHALGGFFAKPRPLLSGDFVTTDSGTGLVHMAPDHGEDDFDLCKANGIDPTKNPNLTISVTQPAGSPRRLSVEIRDSQVATMFGRSVKSSFDVGRSAVGEYVPSIPVGSPVNQLGYAPDQNFWLAVNGYCTAKEDGDRYLSGYDGTRNSTGTYGCGTGPQPLLNTDYNNTRSGTNPVPATSGGYSYIVRVPCATSADPTIPCASTDRTTTAVTIQIFDPWFNAGLPSSPDVIPNAQCLDPSSSLYNTCGVTTKVQVYPPDSTPNDYNDDVGVFASPQVYGTNGCACAVADWQTLYTVPVGAQAGSWRVQVYTLDNERQVRGVGWNSFAVNGFALRAFSGSVYAACTTISTSRSASSR